LGSAGESADLIGFRNALLEQHKERYFALKRSVDDDLADIITARRLEVEGIVQAVRRFCETRLAEGLKANRRYEKLQKRMYAVELQNAFFRELEEAQQRRFEVFRRSPRYKDAMYALAAEALENYGLSIRTQGGKPPRELRLIALVEKGDAVFLPPQENIVEIREELKDVWGGLALVEERKGGGRLVDNTFRTRWRRLYPSFVAGHRDVFTALAGD
jgi:hypothetical protein